MSTNDPFTNPEKLLAAIDFAEMTASQNIKHKKEIKSLLCGFLDVLDSLQALEVHIVNSTNFQKPIPPRTLRTIIRMFLRKYQEIGVKPMNAVGQSLDLDLHQVIGIAQDSKRPNNTVLEETFRGYLWNGRLLRRAKVVVSTNDQSENLDRY